MYLPLKSSWRSHFGHFNGRHTHWIQSLCSARNRSASIAALHPSAAAVIACLYLWSRTSPAAKTPGTLVSVSFPVTTYPCESSSTLPFKNPVFGSYPIATNTPSAFTWLSFPLFRLWSWTPVTFSPPVISFTVESHMKRIFGFALALSCIILLARNVSLRCTTVTLFVMFARKLASSIAVSPPPTVTTSFPLKKNPSQVAQLETPLPLNLVSEGSPSHLALAPVAMITLFPSYVFPPAAILKGLDEKSTKDTSS